MPHKKTFANSSVDVKTVTVPKEEYDRLRIVASHFEMMRDFFAFDFFTQPTMRDSDSVMREFEKTGKDNKAFLKSLKQGIKESSYFHASH